MGGSHPRPRRGRSWPGTRRRPDQRHSPPPPPHATRRMAGSSRGFRGRRGAANGSGSGGRGEGGRGRPRPPPPPARGQRRRQRPARAAGAAGAKDVGRPRRRHRRRGEEATGSKGGRGGEEARRAPRRGRRRARTAAVPAATPRHVVGTEREGAVQKGSKNRKGGRRGPVVGLSRVGAPSPSPRASRPRPSRSVQGRRGVLLPPLPMVHGADSRPMGWAADGVFANHDSRCHADCSCTPSGGVPRRSPVSQSRFRHLIHCIILYM